MELHVRRDQQAVKGMLGGDKGVSFTLSYQLVLSDEEAKLVEKYKLSNYPLTWRSVQGTRVSDDTIASMVRGVSTTLQDVTTLVKNEDVVKDACDVLPVLFDVVRTFGGSEVIKYPRSR